MKPIIILDFKRINEYNDFIRDYEVDVLTALRIEANTRERLAETVRFQLPPLPGFDYDPSYEQKDRFIVFKKSKEIRQDNRPVTWVYFFERYA